ncbi:hypothetical protein BDR26DRAFT_872818, partial [Obelidium mucronatum]
PKMPLPALGPKYTWAGWANQQSYVAGFCEFFILCGGIITTIWYPKLPGNVMALPVGIATIVLGALIMGIEYPMPYIHNLGIAYTSYYFRIGLYALILGVSMLQCPSQTGGLCLLCAIITYLRAALSGETCAVPKAKKGGRK